jgi:hypothetical protein
LRRLQCDEVQGYLIGPPMTARDFVVWLQQRGHERPLDPASGMPEPLSAA